MHYGFKAALAVTAGLMLSSAVLTTAVAADKPTLAFVANVASDFWKAAEAGMKKAQAELPDYNLEFKYPASGTTADQQRLMDDLVTAGVKAIMVSAVDPKTQTDGLNKIASQTALFTTDSDAPQSNRIAYVGSSNVLAGNQAAEIAKKAMPDGGKCMGFVGLLDAANYKERAQGFTEGLKGTKITLVDTRADGGDQTKAKSNVEDVLTADPSITCMVGFYSYNTPQIYQALKESGKLGQITVVGFDDDPITLGGVADGSIAGTVVQQPFEWAYQGFKMMAAYVGGDKSVIPANKLDIVPTKILYKADIPAYEANLKAMASGQ
jgi:ribose transport system substrate-binding protein